MIANSESRHLAQAQANQTQARLHHWCILITLTELMRDIALKAWSSAADLVFGHRDINRLGLHSMHIITLIDVMRHTV